MPFTFRPGAGPNLPPVRPPGGGAAHPRRLFGLFRRERPVCPDRLARQIILPSLPVTDEEIARATHQDSGQRLARQDLWEDLSQRIRYADDARLTTPGGESAAALLAFGARGDVVAAAEDALHDGALPDPAGLEALEAIQADLPDDYGCALVVALAHVDIACAWAAAHVHGHGHGHPLERDLRLRSHLARARHLLAPFDGVDLDAPSLAAAQCALAARAPGGKTGMADAYERLIGLDPDCPRHMRALGLNLLPAHGGSYRQLELEARRTAAGTQDVWGAGGYAWVHLDALMRDRGALAHLDCDFFVDGLHDILARKDNQHVVNLLAAFCAIAMAPAMGKARLPAPAETARARLHDCLGWLLERHLRELHPLIWAQILLTPGAAAPLPSRRALVDRGRQAALGAIAERFADDIADGACIVFSAAGMSRRPAP